MTDANVGPRDTEAGAAAALLRLRAADAEQLRAAAGALAAQLSDTPDGPMGEAASEPPEAPYRLALVARRRHEARDLLRDFVDGRSRPGLFHGVASVDGPGPVWIFTGQGSQWPGMGASLLRAEPVFEAALSACADALERQVEWSLLEQLSADATRSRFDEVDVVQPVLFALQVAQAALWRSWGLEPARVIGHSLGEVAAAHVAGALSLDDAARVVCARSAGVRQHAAGRGAMAVVEQAPALVEPLLARLRLSIAAYNGPSTTVVAGAPEPIAQLVTALTAQGTFARAIDVDYASHTEMMDAVCERLFTQLSGLRPTKPHVPMVSTVTGSPLAEPLDAGYWCRNLRQPVLFHQGLAGLLASGHRAFLELGGHPTVGRWVRLNHPGAVVTATFRRGGDERLAMLEALGALDVVGVSVDSNRRATCAGSACPDTRAARP